VTFDKQNVVDIPAAATGQHCAKAQAVTVPEGLAVRRALVPARARVGHPLQSWRWVLVVRCIPAFLACGPPLSQDGPHGIPRALSKQRMLPCREFAASIRPVDRAFASFRVVRGIA